MSFVIRVACAWVCVAVLVALPARAVASDREAFAGTWVRDERERDDAARDAAIGRATESLWFAIRGLARDVMRSRMAPPERYVIEEDGAAPVIRDDKGVEVAVDGRPHAIGKDHEVASRIVAAREIEQVWKHGSDSHGTTRWRFLEDRNHLVVSHRVHDVHFEQPIEYSTTYRRLGQ